ncbi:hypothetical protein VPHD171_0024 [Vibrio phage D171]
MDNARCKLRAFSAEHQKRPFLKSGFFMSEFSCCKFNQIQLM